MIAVYANEVAPEESLDVILNRECAADKIVNTESVKLREHSVDDEVLFDAEGLGQVDDALPDDPPDDPVARGAQQNEQPVAREQAAEEPEPMVVEPGRPHAGRRGNRGSGNRANRGRGVPRHRGKRGRGAGNAPARAANIHQRHDDEVCIGR